VTQPLLDLIDVNEENLQFSLNIMDERDEEEGFDNGMMSFEWEFVSFEGKELVM
jgi:hypothetical protein